MLDRLIFSIAQCVQVLPCRAAPWPRPCRELFTVIRNLLYPITLWHHCMSIVFTLRIMVSRWRQSEKNAEKNHDQTEFTKRGLDRGMPTKHHSYRRTNFDIKYIDTRPFEAKLSKSRKIWSKFLIFSVILSPSVNRLWRHRLIGQSTAISKARLKRAWITDRKESWPYCASLELIHNNSTCCSGYLLLFHLEKIFEKEQAAEKLK